MKNRQKRVFSLILTGVLVLCFLLQSFPAIDAQAASLPVYQAGKDIDYTDGEGAEVELTHKREEEAIIASYEVNDTRLTRNATYYMSMQVKFDNSHSWVIRLRNVTCKIKGETVTGNMQFHLFKNNGSLQVGGKAIDNWPTFNNINDDEWHEITVRSTVDSFELWVDGVRGRSLYYLPEVTDMVTNYTCPAVTLAGYNSGTVKNIRVWNDGAEENPVMPADRVAQRIESLPDAVSLKDSERKLVADVTAEYEALSEAEKAYVINYDKLLQLQRVSGNGDGRYDIMVSGSAEGAFSALFPKGIVSQQKGNKPLKYYFETEASRNSTYYMQCVVNLAQDSNCFDIFLRNQRHTVNGKSVTGPVSIRLFKHSAVVLDSRQNEISGWINYKLNLLDGSHVITVESTPTSCTLWIDEVKYEVPDYLGKVSGVDCIQAQPGIGMTADVTGTISDIRVWNDGNSGAGGQNRYAAGDAARIAIFRLPKLQELSPADASNIKVARKLCDELTQKEQKYVTNLSKLTQLERAMELLEKTGDHAYAFLKDDLPVVQEDYLNLISTGSLVVPAEYNSMVDYNAQTHELNYKDSKEYINTPFQNIKGIAADDTWLLKFNYIPHEYYYETESAGWMGLRITFAGYRSDDGSGPRNRHQFAFMVNQTGLLSIANGTSAPDLYQPGFVAKMDEEYQVTMLCERGRMKIWVNGEAVAYFDDLALYPFSLEFESSRCRCDIKDIQLYNMSTPTVLKTSEEKSGGFQYIEDLLYDVQGVTPEGRLAEKKSAWMLAAAFVASVALLAIVVWIVCLTRKATKPREKAKGGSDQ